MEVFCEHNIYVTTKIDITLGADAPMELHTGYHKLLLALKYSNKTCVFLPVNLLTTDNSILETDDISTKMSALMRHFTATSNIREKMCSVWETARLGFDGDVDMMMSHTDYNLRADNILIMKKRLQLPFTETIFYLQFVKILLTLIRRRSRYKGI